MLRNKRHNQICMCGYPLNADEALKAKNNLHQMNSSHSRANKIRDICPQLLQRNHVSFMKGKKYNKVLETN